jgi:hypothetical protein
MVTFNVTAVGAAGLRYQWQFNSADIPNATNRTLVITNVQQIHEGEYAAIVSSGTASTRSAAAQLSLLRHPLIIQQPQDQTVPSGSTVTLRVVADGSGALRYQWLFNDTPIDSATATNLTLANVRLEHAGDYTVLVRDDAGAILSDPAQLKVLARPVITEQPLGQSVAPGEMVVFSVAATGTLPMTYRWRRNGFILTNMVLNESRSFLTILHAQPADAGNYEIGIINEAGPSSGLSSNAVLTVLPDTDGDGIADPWESAHGLTFDDSSDAAMDADNDRASNLQEYHAGTDPNSAESYLRIQRITLAPGGTSRIEFLAASNRTYALEFQDEAQTADWRMLADMVAAPTNRIVEFLDTAIPPAGQRRFYRLVTPRPP